MKNNDSTQIVTISENLIRLIKNKNISNDIKNLMETEEIDCDEHEDFDEKLISALVKLCEDDGKITPKNTVAKLEEMLLRSKHSPNTYFIGRYAYCLSCSCKDQDEDYIQNAVQKLRLIIQNVDEIDTTNLIEQYIACLSMLSAEQAPEKAKQTISEMKHICDEVDAWDNPRIMFKYCSALHRLCLNQSRAEDLQGALETLEILVNLVYNNEDIEEINIVLCYADALHYVCMNEELSIRETFEITKRLESLLAQTQNMDNDEIAISYMIGLTFLGSKEKKQSQNTKTTFERARLVAENARYKSNKEVIEWYAALLLFIMDGYDLDSVRFTHGKMTELNTGAIKESERFTRYYSNVKHIMKWQISRNAL